MKINKKMLIAGMPARTYHHDLADPDGRPLLSSSGLRLFDRSPAHWKADREQPKEATPAMVLGSAIHTATLEPELFKKEYAIAPDVDRRTKAGKQAWADFCLESEGKTPIKQADWGLIRRVRDSVCNHLEASALLACAGQFEMSGFWRHWSGCWCKLRADIVTDSGIVVDLKTTVDASPKGFALEVARRRYHWQAAFYCSGLEEITGGRHDEFWFIAVEKEPPFAVAVHSLNPAHLEIAEDQIEPVIQDFGKCLGRDEWPGYESGEALDLPAWALRLENVDYQSLYN